MDVNKGDFVSSSDLINDLIKQSLPNKTLSPADLTKKVSVPVHKTKDASPNIGIFSFFVEVETETNDQTLISVPNSAGLIPKLVIVSCDNPVEGKLQGGYFTPVGGFYVGASGSVGASDYVAYKVDEIISTTRIFAFSEELIQIRRYGAGAGMWSTTATYKVGIYY